MGKQNNRPPREPNFTLVPPPPGAADPHQNALGASLEALARAAEAASSGDLARAELETRLAERFDRIARRAPPPPESEKEPEPDGEAFLHELERRINLFRAQERAELDELKRTQPALWQMKYEEALNKAVEDARASTEAFWTGDPHLFEEPEGGYPPSPIA